MALEVILSCEAASRTIESKDVTGISPDLSLHGKLDA
jgi:hypothetical protein